MMTLENALTEITRNECIGCECANIDERCSERNCAFYTVFKSCEELQQRQEQDKKGDCISREALKKALKSNCKPEICHDYGTNWCESCCPHNDFEDLIDNAQAVDARPQGDLISRSELKKHKVRSKERCEYVVPVYNIDNAPTVPLQNEQITWEQGYECGYHQAKGDAIRRIAEQYSEHNELIPKWLSVGDMKGGAE